MEAPGETNAGASCVRAEMGVECVEGRAEAEYAGAGCRCCVMDEEWRISSIFPQWCSGRQ